MIVIFVIIITGDVDYYEIYALMYVVRCSLTIFKCLGMPISIFVIRKRNDTCHTPLGPTKRKA